MAKEHHPHHHKHHSNKKLIIGSLLVAYTPLLIEGLYSLPFNPEEFLSFNIPYIIVATMIAGLLLMITFIMQRSPLLSSRLFLVSAILNIFFIHAILWFLMTHWWDLFVLEMALDKMCTAPVVVQDFLPSEILKYCRY